MVGSPEGRAGAKDLESEENKSLFHWLLPPAMLSLSSLLDKHCATHDIHRLWNSGVQKHKETVKSKLNPTGTDKSFLTFIEA